MTGILLAWASLRTSSKPVLVLGARMIASTLWLMNERKALIWFSGLPWASENFRLMLRFLASSWMDWVSAVRQEDSAPTWEKPTVRGLPPEPPPAVPVLPESRSQAVRARAVRRLSVICARRFIEDSFGS